MTRPTPTTEQIKWLDETKRLYDKYGKLSIAQLMDRTEQAETKLAALKAENGVLKDDSALGATVRGMREQIHTARGRMLWEDSPPVVLLTMFDKLLAAIDAAPSIPPEKD